MTDAKRLGRRPLIIAMTVSAAIAFTLAGWLLEGNRSASLDATATTAATEIANEGDARAAGETSRPIPPASTRSVATRRSTTQATLPSPDMPLNQTYDALKALADAGDAAAATRLFADARQCFRSRMMLQTMPRVARSLLSEDASKLDAKQLKAEEQNLTQLQEQLEKTRTDAANCDGLSTSQLQLTPLALQAAELGDSEAARCYVSGLTLYVGGLLDHPEWLSQYRSNALPLADAAVKRGDWSMVAQLRSSYAGESSFYPMGQLLGINLSLSYRYLKLQRLGAPASSNARLDDELAVAMHDLSAEQITSGDSWAQDAYLRYFDGQPASRDATGMERCP